MSSKRTFWTKLNHDDARLSIEMMEDEEVGRWFRGWLAGAGGKEYAPDKIAALPVEMRTGFAAGRESFAEAERYSEKQRERVSKRYHGSTTVDHGSTTEEFGSVKATESIPSNSEQRTANNQQQKAKSEKREKIPPKAPQGATEILDLWNALPSPLPKARMTPERSRIMAARLKEPGWMEDFRDALLYVAEDPFSQGQNDRGWVVNLDYLLRPGKAVAAAEKFRAPKVTRPTNSPGSPPPPRQMTPEEQNRLRGHRMDLEKAERDLRVARNNPHNYDVDEARRKVDEVKARILKMGADPEVKP